MDNFDISKLITIHLTGEISEQQRQQLMTWVESTVENKRIFDSICKSTKLQQKLATYRNTDWQTLDFP